MTQVLRSNSEGNGWSAKLPLSILTDFEEFSVYDTRVRRPRRTRRQRLGFSTFGTPTTSVAGRRLPTSLLATQSSQVRLTLMRRPTGAKRGTDAVDESFLEEMESWRDALARTLALRNQDLGLRPLNSAVQKTIDRIIFLRICEDRGIEPYGQLMASLKGSNVYGRLAHLFRQADERYNSGLFHFRNEPGRDEPPDTQTLSLTIDDKTLKGIISNLYYPDSPYEFSVFSADILGQVYEQFLGKVIRLTPSHRAKVEEKPEVRKSGGVYYTPTSVVDYLVQNTVGSLLGVASSPSKAASLKILDPACGSGSFLISAYQFLLDWHLAWYQEDGVDKHSKGRTAKVYEGPGRNGG